jgi:hypothetical protein
MPSSSTRRIDSTPPGVASGVRSLSGTGVTAASTAGRKIVNDAPAPGSLSTSMKPPLCLTIP